MWIYVNEIDNYTLAQLQLNKKLFTEHSLTVFIADVALEVVDRLFVVIIHCETDSLAASPLIIHCNIHHGSKTIARTRLYSMNEFLLLCR